MARGWESKAVEEQISAAEARRASDKSALTPAEVERRKRRNALLLSRTRIIKDLEAAHDERYRALLKNTLAHVEEEIARLGPQS